MAIKLQYRLRHLIYQKYGEDKFALGCELVARWVRLDIDSSGVRWTAPMVLQLCNATTKSNYPLYPNEGEALRRLFGLNSIEELFTK